MLSLPSHLKTAYSGSCVIVSFSGVYRYDASPHHGSLFRTEKLDDGDQFFGLPHHSTRKTVLDKIGVSSGVVSRKPIHCVIGSLKASGGDTRNNNSVLR